MADFFFFTDTAHLENQNSSDQAFGPVAGNETTQFRVTSLHKGKIDGDDRIDPVAYSICSGHVRLQQDNTNPDLLNLVLAPNSDLIYGLPIKYFIYRGIRRDSLIDNNNKLIPGELTNLLLNEGLENDTPEALGLAFKPAADNPSDSSFIREDSDSIDTLFFELTTLKAILVNKSGLKLGLFHGGHFGIDIVLDSCWEDTTINILRNIDISSIGGKGNIIDVPSSSNLIQARAIRERVYKYMDVTAFLGLLRPKDISYAVSSLQNSSTISNHQNLYNGILAKFHNKHKIYIDIRNENGLSYNYYDNYGSGEIILITDNTNLTWRNKINPAISYNQSTSYLTHEWPIKIIDGNEASFIIKNGSKKSGIRIALNLGDGSKERRAIVRTGFLYYNKNGKSFLGKLYKPKKDASILNIISSEDWTKEITLATPIATVSNALKPISSYVRLLYDREHTTIPDEQGRFIATPSSWDNLFIIKPNFNKWKSNRLSSWWLTGQLKFVSPQLGNQQVYQGLAESGIAIDRDHINMEDARITFYYVPIIALKKPTNFRVISGVAVAGTRGLSEQPGSFFQLKESGPINNGALTLHLQKVSEYIGEPEYPNPYLNFLTYTESLPKHEVDGEYVNPDSPQANLNNSKESLYAISMMASEYQILVSEISNQNFDTSLHPVFLQASIVNGRDSGTATERAYQKMELSLVGYNSDGEFQRYIIPTNSVQPLSLMSDGHLFCTDMAAKFEPTPVNWDYTEICEIIKNSNNTSEDHENDTKYYRSALSQIKRYNPVFYSRMENLRLIGAEVILHDRPFEKVRKKYRITIEFDPNFHDASGETKADSFYKGTFPETSSPKFSNEGIQISDLTTPKAIDNLSKPSEINNLYSNDAIGHLNATRYALLNRDLNLNSSQVFEAFMLDYTDLEIESGGDGVFDGKKLYLESIYNKNGKGESPLHRITLANTINLGFGTLDPQIPIKIKINRTDNDLGMYNDKYSSQSIEYYDAYNTFIKEEKVDEIDPRQSFILRILIHELGHAEYSIKNPTIDLIWSWIESYFKGVVTNYQKTIIKKEGVGDGLKDYYLTPYAEYPTPSSIIKWEFVPDPIGDLTDAQKKALANQFDQNLFAMGFYAKTGGGHLRGNPNAQNACLEERILAEEISKENTRIVEKIKIQKQPENAIKVKITPATSVDYAYSFLNYDDSILKKKP